MMLLEPLSLLMVVKCLSVFNCITAFESIDHGHLLAKLRHCGCGNVILSSSYLSGRPQLMVLDANAILFSIKTFRRVP